MIINITISFEILTYLFSIVLLFYSQNSSTEKIFSLFIKICCSCIVSFLFKVVIYVKMQKTKYFYYCPSNHGFISLATQYYPLKVHVIFYRKQFWNDLSYIVFLFTFCVISFFKNIPSKSFMDVFIPVLCIAYILYFCCKNGVYVGVCVCV